MRLLYLDPSPLPSDVTASLQLLQSCCGLAKHVESLSLFVSRSRGEDISGYYGLPLPGNLSVKRLPALRMRGKRLRWSWNLPFHFLSLLWTLAALRSTRIDALLFRNLKLAAFFLKAGGIVALPPLIFETHECFTISLQEELRRRGVSSDGKVRRLMALEAFVYQNVDGIITLTSRLKELIKERFPISRRISSIPDGVDLTKYPFQPLSQQGERLVLYIGSLHPWKGIEDLIKAMKYLPEAKLRIVGGKPGRIEELKALALSEGVFRRVEFTGYVAPRDRFQHFAQASVFVLPFSKASIAGDFTSPLKLFEYMASGRPIVASDLPSLREVLIDGGNALLVQPEDPRALAAGIQQVLGDPALAEKLVAQARKDVKQYTWEERGRRIVQFIREVLEDRTGRI